MKGDSTAGENTDSVPVPATADPDPLSSTETAAAADGNEGAPSSPDASESAARASTPETLTLPPQGELEIEEVAPGSGPRALAGAEVAVVYRLYLAGDRLVEENTAREPLRFRRESGVVIAGLDRGMEGLQAGGRRRLSIPSSLAWGQRGRRDVETGKWLVPPGSRVEVEIELLEVAP